MSEKSTNAIGKGRARFWHYIQRTGLGWLKQHNRYRTVCGIYDFILDKVGPCVGVSGALVSTRGPIATKEAPSAISIWANFVGTLAHDLTDILNQRDREFIASVQPVPEV